MEPIRKPFVLDPIFPFEIVYKGVRYTENELPDHLHDLYELVYVHEGKGMIFIDHALYDKEPGDLFLIPGNTVHRSFPSDADPIVSTALFFAPSLLQPESLGDDYEPLLSFEAARGSKQYRLALSPSKRPKIEGILRSMSDEWRSRTPGYRHALRLYLQNLLLEVSRHPSSQAPSEPSAFGPPWIRKALRDIHLDPVGCGGLSKLSDDACVSAAHFSRVFKQHTGMNVTDYVNAKRLILVKELLLSTDDTVETIAQACGFQGMRHFYQIFRKLTGTTPYAYRKQMK
ncbi:helix-turn-helix domain-containing protein [Cohnella sp. AR92]|uniref:helix-turn-helix domain-containing protein n=1 Tax=Cohnella sp. AR92 TaxID=648716 RepID=UPI000F8DA1F4|nr:helix-turn-helix domain-containing protein [Cohnella sp. AR92]RUS45680.1 AraC family transcriptional regulator [Cohnella sp. AR92]